MVLGYLWPNHKKEFYEEKKHFTMADGYWPGGISYELFPM